jgi:predicted Zn finger-like uncharacterized protein
MALATQCPHCKTIFRVAQDQLKLRGGIVRCGSCHEIFDGNASLVGLDAATAAPTEAPLAPPSAADDSTAHSPAEPVAAASDEVPVYALDLGAALGPLGILPKPEADDDDEHDASEPAHLDEDDSPAPAAIAHEPALPGSFDELQADEASGEPHAVPVGQEADAEPPSASPVGEPEPVMAIGGGRVEPMPDHAGEALVATAPAEEHDLDFGSATTVDSSGHSSVDYTPLPQRESADGAFAAPPPPPKSARARQQARRSKLTPTRIDAPKLRVPEIDEPEFVKRGRQREQSGKQRLILMAVGAVVLLVVLATQAAVIFRNDLAARLPGTRPALSALCSLLRCRVELPARIDNLTIETGELQTLGPDTYVLATLLHNQGGAMQAWPDIELALTDATDKPLVRRVFAPADYVPKGAAAGFAAHGEQAVKLYFRLDQLKPSGYHIAVFYP